MPAVFWFRRDLRLEDNRALLEALKSNTQVYPIFIFDPGILNQLDQPNDRRVQYIYQQLQNIQKQLQKFKAHLNVFYGAPEKIIKSCCKNWKVQAVFANHDYEPYARKRDAGIADLLKPLGIAFNTFKDQCIFEKNEILKSDGSPYTVFTPYSRTWHKTLQSQHYTPFDSSPYWNRLAPGNSTWPSLEDMGFKPALEPVHTAELPSAQLLAQYAHQRDIPSVKGTSRLSMALRFGTVSIRAALRQALPYSQAWVNELIWRDFYMMILWHFPHVTEGAFKPAYNFIPWRTDEAAFERWCRGETGFPIVDAGMRELNTTGFMHNRVRMIVSSFLVKDLLIDWRWGEAYFAKTLNDFDLSANNGGWQWAAGTGCDAAPYFRVFNPDSQQKKFDPQGLYVRQWIPELGTSRYPKPMVDHAAARIRAVETYRNALAGFRQLNLGF